ncbi:MAG: hypothetical protein V3V32_04640 [Dehalococcoidia bacterium]
MAAKATKDIVSQLGKESIIPFCLAVCRPVAVEEDNVVVLAVKTYVEMGRLAIPHNREQLEAFLSGILSRPIVVRVVLHRYE